MIRIAACDGKTSYVCELVQILREWGEKKGRELECCACSTADALLLESELHGHLDLVFLDLHPEGAQSGVSTALMFKKMDPMADIVFVLSETLIEPEVIRVKPLDYLEKPLQKHRLTELLERWIRHRRPDRFCFSIRQIRYALPVDGIRYIYHFSRKIYIYMNDGECPEAYMRLEEAERRLRECDVVFLKAHSSYLVNPSYVSKVGKSMIRLDRGEELPVARSRGKEICGMFDAYIRLYSKSL